MIAGSCSSLGLSAFSREDRRSVAHGRGKAGRGARRSDQVGEGEDHGRIIYSVAN